MSSVSLSVSLCVSLSVRAALAAASLACLPMTGAAAAEGITTTGTFNSFSGDVDPVSGPGAGIYEVFVNGSLLLPGPQVVDGYYQGTRSLPAGTTAVEFKDRQRGLDFATPNLISFTGAQVATPASVSTPFLLGTITVTNGIWFSQASASLTVRTSAPGTPFDNRSFTDTLRYTVTPNTGTADQNADALAFDGHLALGRIRVYEAASGLGNTGSVDLYGRVGSLIPAFFANPTGGVYIQAVPEPEGWLLLTLGMAVLAGVGRRRQARQPR